MEGCNTTDKVSDADFPLDHTGWSMSAGSVQNTAEMHTDT